MAILGGQSVLAVGTQGGPACELLLGEGTQPSFITWMIRAEQMKMSASPGAQAVTQSLLREFGFDEAWEPAGIDEEILGDFPRLLTAVRTIDSQISDEDGRGFLLQLFADPNYRPALIKIGTEVRPFPFQAKVTFRNLLVHLVPLLSKLPSEVGGELLSRVCEEYHQALLKLKPGQIRRLDSFVPIAVNWEGENVLNRLDVLIERVRESRLKHDWPELRSLKASTRGLIEDSLFLFLNSRSRSILARLNSFSWFVTYTPSNQAKVFFVLNYCAYIAENSTISMQKDLLKNTVNLVDCGREIGVEKPENLTIVG